MDWSGRNSCEQVEARTEVDAHSSTLFDPLTVNFRPGTRSDKMQDALCIARQSVSDPVEKFWRRRNVFTADRVRSDSNMLDYNIGASASQFRNGRVPSRDTHYSLGGRQQAIEIDENPDVQVGGCEHRRLRQKIRQFERQIPTANLSTNPPHIWREPRQYLFDNMWDGRPQTKDANDVGCEHGHLERAVESQNEVRGWYEPISLYFNDLGGNLPIKIGRRALRSSVGNQVGFAVSQPYYRIGSPLVQCLLDETDHIIRSRIRNDFVPIATKRGLKPLDIIDLPFRSKFIGEANKVSFQTHFTVPKLGAEAGAARY
jgi:hypothetical protein